MLIYSSSRSQWPCLGQITCSKGPNNCSANSYVPKNEILNRNKPKGLLKEDDDDDDDFIFLLRELL
jgi:hypothetical protein